MKKTFAILLLIISCQQEPMAQPAAPYNLSFAGLPQHWDEAIPLGNAWLGALIWQKNDKLRMSLDRVDLWDDRPMPLIDELQFGWVKERLEANNYDTVQQLGDRPYESNAAPTKIPGAAIEFDLNKLGQAIHADLDISNGLSTVTFSNGTVLHSYIHAKKNVGYFGFEKLKRMDILPVLVAPQYQKSAAGAAANSVEGQGLQRLGYPQGTVTQNKNSIRYHQPCGGKNYYEVLVEWVQNGKDGLLGQWTISFNQQARLPAINTKRSEPTGWPDHLAWWKDYWMRSAVHIPDSLLQRQYYLEMYKFACVARHNSPPISLQAVWTADNGKLPPWKGDFHHDLNTELSYWPGYNANHTDLTSGFTNWLWSIRGENRKWTRQYFQVEGINVPGVTTITGKPMGGWIQYSMSPTTAAWLAQHVYWQWKYTAEKRFLKERAYPWFREVQQYFAAMLKKDAQGHYQLPLSSSPEYHDNSPKAWFSSFTNYDLALLKSFYQEWQEVQMAATGRPDSAALVIEKGLPDWDVDSTGLTIAHGQDLDQSHRHHAQLMAIYPMQLLNARDSSDRALINRSLTHLEHIGTRAWCGYSFSWAACIYARALQGEKAVQQLEIFARNFCSPNSFHLNGDQKGGMYSSFTYRPFTLEGNFAFAQGIHELLLQEQDNCIYIFPALPSQWKNVSFSNLLCQGGFLLSASRQLGINKSVKVVAQHAGWLRLQLPFSSWQTEGEERSRIKVSDPGKIEVFLHRGQSITFTNAIE